VFETPASTASIAGDCRITPSGQRADNSLTFVDGVLQVRSVAVVQDVLASAVTNMLPGLSLTVIDLGVKLLGGVKSGDPTNGATQ
jgi:hypothetical protein